MNLNKGSYQIAWQENDSDSETPDRMTTETSCEKNDDLNEKADQKKHKNRKRFPAWALIIVIAVCFCFLNFLEMPKWVSVFIIAVIAFSIIGMIFAIIWNSKPSMPTPQETKKDQHPQISDEDRCLRWYESLKERSKKERDKDSIWQSGRYLQCILVHCIDDISLNNEQFQIGKSIKLIREYNDPQNINAIAVISDNETILGYVSKQCCTIPAGLMNSGIHLFARIYDIRAFGCNKCLVIEIFVDDSIVCLQ